MLRAILLTTALIVLAGGMADAQQLVVEQRPKIEPRSEVRVQVNISFFVPGAVNGSEASLKVQEDARRSLYHSAARECEVLRETIATECRLESLNVNINRTYGAPQNEGFTANGNFGFRVTLK